MRVFVHNPSFTGNLRPGSSRTAVSELSGLAVTPPFFGICLTIEKLNVIAAALAALMELRGNDDPKLLEAAEKLREAVGLEERH